MYDSFILGIFDSFMLLNLIFGRALIHQILDFSHFSKCCQSSLIYPLIFYESSVMNTVNTIIKPLYNCTSTVGSCHSFLTLWQIFISQCCLILLSAERAAVCLQPVLDWHVQVYWESVQSDVAKSRVRLMQTCIIVLNTLWPKHNWARSTSISTTHLLIEQLSSGT